MNEAFKKERFRTKGQESDASASDSHMLNSSQGSRVVCISHTQSCYSLFPNSRVNSLKILGLSYVHLDFACLSIAFH